MSLYKNAVKRPVTILMIVIAVLIIGGVSLNRLSVDLYPDIELPIVATLVNYEGVGPEEMERLVTRPVEDAVATLPGIKQISSQSGRGSSFVIAEFDYGTDMDFSEMKVRENVDTIRAFLPEDASSPMIFRFDLEMFPLMIMGVTGDRESYEIKEIVEEKIKPFIERAEGVANVDTSGGDTREIQVIVDAQRLQTYGLTINDLQNVIRAENANFSSGSVEQGKKEYLVRVKGEFESLEDLGNVLVPLRGGGNIELRYIADIQDAFAKATMYSFLNGQNSIGLSIFKQSDANAVEVSRNVNDAIERINEELPAGIEIGTAFDSAEFINQSISSVARNGLLGASFAIIVLYLFLRNIRSTLIIGTAIPIAIISTFILMYFSGTTINIVSLGGLALGIGLMVDSSIVVLENIYRYRTEKNHNRADAAIAGTKEVSSAVVAATLTTICVFLPMVFVEGLSAQLFRPMALTVSFALFSALMVALTFIPMLSSKFLTVNKRDVVSEAVPCQETGRMDQQEENVKPHTKVARNISDKWQGLIESTKCKYQNFLKKALNNRKKVMAITAIGIVLSGVLFTFVGKEFIPSADSGYFTVDLRLPRNTMIEETKLATEKVELILAQIKEVDQVFVTVGGGGGALTGNFGASSRMSNVTVRMAPLNERDRSVQDVMEEVRERTKDMAGVNVTVSADDGGFGGGGSPIAIEIKGSDLDTLRGLSDEIAARVERVEGTRNVTTSFEGASPEIEILIDRTKANSYGLTTAQIAGTLRQGVSGVTATRYREQGNEYNVRILLREEQRNDLDSIKRMMITTPAGQNVPLEELGEISFADGVTGINRVDQSRVATVRGDLTGRDLASVSADIREEINDVILPRGYTADFAGANQDMVEAFTNLAFALLLAIILVYMVMASQFEALMYPFVIMFSIPPTFIGITLGLFLTGRSFGVTAFIGVIMLSGIVVNNAIVLVDYINQLRKSGMEKMEAIIEAGRVRFRPILMTTLTTVLALIPQTVGIGEGAELMAPMATVVVFGLSFSTLITLVLVPVVYYSLDSFAYKYKEKIGKAITGGQE